MGNPLFFQKILDTQAPTPYKLLPVNALPTRPRFAAPRVLLLILPTVAACQEDEITWVQVNGEEDCIALQVVSDSASCPSESEQVTAEVTCCDDAVIGSITATPGCGTVDTEFSVDVILETDDPDIDLSDAERVTVSVPNPEENLQEFRLERSDLQDNLWEITLAPGSSGGTDRTDSLCFAVWEADESDESSGDDDSGS